MHILTMLINVVHFIVIKRELAHYDKKVGHPGPRSRYQIVNLRLCRFAGIAAAGFDGEAEAAADVEGVDTGAAAAGGEAAAAAGAADPCTACLCGGTDPGNGISANPAFNENKIMRHKEYR